MRRSCERSPGAIPACCDSGMSGPRGVAPSAHLAINSISTALKLASLTKSPYPATADHGGMAPDSTCSRIAFAHGLASW